MFCSKLEPEEMWKLGKIIDDIFLCSIDVLIGVLLILLHNRFNIINKEQLGENTKCTLCNHTFVLSLIYIKMVFYNTKVKSLW